MHRTEIAKQLNLSRQSIHRILGLVEERLEKRFDTLSGKISKLGEKIGVRFTLLLANAIRT